MLIRALLCFAVGITLIKAADDCLSNPCQNEGTCEQITPSGYRCDCLPDFVGTNCERALSRSCDNFTCENNGVCFEDMRLPSGAYCVCSFGYDGPQCEIGILCDTSGISCLNGGHCEDQDSPPHCVCLQDITGERCETIIDGCTGVTCYNNGKCVPGLVGSSYNCDCANGYIGRHCEDPEHTNAGHAVTAKSDLQWIYLHSMLLLLQIYKG